MEPEKPRPILSLCADDPEVQERLDAFVVSLGERVDILQDAELAGDLKQLEGLALAFGREAREVGYPALAEVATAIADACVDGARTRVRHLLERLTEVTRRVRLGHRSAA